MKLLIVLLFSFGIKSAEIDHFTDYYKNLPDSTNIINKQANHYVQMALLQANESGFCDKTELFKSLEIYFGNHLRLGDIIRGEVFVNFLKHDYRVAKKQTSLDHSIYQDWSFYDGIFLALPTKKESSLTLVPIVKIGGIEVGIDKFEHLFATGLSLYKMYYQKNISLEKTLKFSILKERNLLGGRRYANGVFSFADLVANFNGIRFWNHILADHDDILGEDISPIIKCRNNKWVQVNPVKLETFLGPGVNEAINCSMFPSYTGAEKVLNRFKYLEEKNNKSFTCPMNNQLLDETIKKYDYLGKYLINIYGIQKIPFSHTFENYGK